MDRSASGVRSLALSVDYTTLRRAAPQPAPHLVLVHVRRVCLRLRRRPKVGPRVDLSPEPKLVPCVRDERKAMSVRLRLDIEFGLERREGA